MQALARAPTRFYQGCVGPHSQSCVGQARAYTVPSQERPRRRNVIRFAQGGLGDNEVDVAVFRFTLGIKGFDDRLIPRVVGVAGAALLAINHIAGATPVPQAQAVTELVGGALALVCVAVPEIEVRLREVGPGRGRASAAETVEGATNGFFLSKAVGEASKQELAWSSFALLRNTNVCSVIVHAGGATLAARGALATAAVRAGDVDTTLDNVTRGVESLLSSAAAVASVARGSTPSLWLPDRGAINAAGLGACTAVPSGAQSALVQHIPGKPGRDAFVLVFSERPRALSEREQLWVEAISKKLSAALATA